MSWAIKCNSSTDFHRMVLVFDALDIEVFEVARLRGYDPVTPFLTLFSHIDQSVIRVSPGHNLLVGKEIVEVEDAYEYLIRWKEKW